MLLNESSPRNMLGDFMPVENPGSDEQWAHSLPAGAGKITGGTWPNAGNTPFPAA